MEMIQASKRIHPMMAGAAASVMLVSLLGAAAITGILPSSRGTSSEAAHLATPGVAAVPEMKSNQQAATTPAVIKEVVEHKTVVHHQYVQQHADSSRARPVRVAQAEPVRQYSPAPVYQQPAQQPVPVAQNSPLGIGIGAVVGGLLGSKVGGGNGRTIAAIAGAVGGGYVGNEIAKRN